MIDILLASYNGEKYISEQINSIISQSYEDWKLIIRDDGSNDKTLKIIEEFEKKDRRIQLIRDDKGNLGVARNFEELLSYSKADFIMFADQDDIWFHDKIKDTLLVMKNKNQSIPQLVFTNSTVIKNNESSKCGYLYQYHVIPSLENFLFSNAGYQGSTTMINKELKDKCLPFLEDCLVHDYHISLCALLFGEATFIPESTMYYRRHQATVSTLRRGILDKFKSFLKKEPILFNPELFYYLKRYEEMNRKNINKEKSDILFDYFSILHKNVSKLHGLKIAMKRRFRINGSCFYLLLKIFLLKKHHKK